MEDVFGLRRNRYKANLHTHSVRSDGKFQPEELARLYGKAGYEALAFTDHRKSGAASEERKGMTLLNGIELHPVWKKGESWSSGGMHHFIAVNVPEGFEDLSGLACQDCIDGAVAAGAACFLAHPYWTGLNVHDILALKNLSGIEVFNTSTRYIGKQFNMVHWDGLLDAGWSVPAIAVDDTHRPCDLFQGWTVICAEDRSPEKLTAALKKGDFYSSTGPELRSFEVDFESRHVKAEFSPAVEVVLMADKSLGSCLNVPGNEAKVSGGRLSGKGRFSSMESFEAEAPKDARYVRLQIRDRQGRFAWSNPVRFK